MEVLNGHVPVSLRFFPMDITDRIQLERLKIELETIQPKVIFLVNAAGFGKIGKIGSLPLEAEMGMVQLNAQALLTVTHLVLPYMAKNGRIIQYASAAAFLPQPGFAIYAATKAFVLSYSRGLNTELKGRGICVTAVCPGPVKTEFFDIAESTGKIPLYKRLAMADPTKVVKQAIEDSIMGKSLSIYGITMKLFYILCKGIPHSWILNIWGCLNRNKTVEKR